MIKHFLILVILFFTTKYSFSQQKTEAFHLSLPAKKIANSLYNTLYFIDARSDTTMGLVQLGAFNRVARVVTRVPFTEQLNNVMRLLIDTTAQNGRLLFQLKDLTFSELTNTFNEYGFCHVMAKLYVVLNGTYQPLNLIDTLIVVKSIDVTNGVLKKGASAINNFIAENLTQIPSDTTQYSFADVRNIDNIEKLAIPVYNASTYKDGLYKTYTAFKNQSPDESIEVEMKTNKIASVQIIYTNGKTQNVKPQFIYGIVYNGQPYIANSNYGYCRLQKINDDFVCTGYARVNQNNNSAALMFGLVGALIAGNGSTAKFEMKVDHINGGLIKLRQLN
jgi:uncharacterized protein with FMN-binding domain